MGLELVKSNGSGYKMGVGADMKGYLAAEFEIIFGCTLHGEGRGGVVPAELFHKSRC
jgi:hypothetical protein